MGVCWVMCLHSYWKQNSSKFPQVSEDGWWEPAKCGWCGVQLEQFNSRFFWGGNNFVNFLPFEFLFRIQSDVRKPESQQESGKGTCVETSSRNLSFLW